MKCSCLYLPPCCHRQLPRHRNCCWELPLSLQHIASHGGYRRGRLDEAWDPGRWSSGHSCPLDSEMGHKINVLHFVPGKTSLTGNAVLLFGLGAAVTQRLQLLCETVLITASEYDQFQVLSPFSASTFSIFSLAVTSLDFTIPNHAPSLL